MDQTDVKVTFYLKKSETNAGGRCPVMTRLMVGQSESVFSVKLSVPASLWASDRAKGKSAKAIAINRQLDVYRASTLAIYRKQSAIHELIAVEEVKCLLLGMATGQETLLSYYRTFIEHFEKRVDVNRSIKSAKTYRTTYDHLTRFLSEQLRLSNIPFTASDRLFIDKFDLYLRTERHMVPRTIILNMSRLHTPVNKALAAGIITADLFAGYELLRPERKRRYLTKEELKRLMTTPLPSLRLYLIRDLFLFSCYTGISYGDMCHLTTARLETAEDGAAWIKAAREKTNIEFKVPLYRQIS